MEPDVVSVRLELLAKKVLSDLEYNWESIFDLDDIQTLSAAIAIVELKKRN